ncbi:MAG: replication initiation protein, partial [Proteobacteria bacterium]|nr:replication initiation protein [Pseudomonadota bacterium]
HRVNVTELAKKLGFNSHNEDYLKETLEALVDCIVKWNILGKDKKEEWGVASLLAEARIKDGICTYAYPPYLRTRLYNPRIYTKLNLRLQNQFTNRYALILWEVCFDYFDLSRNEGETPFIPLETFRELMGIKADEYRTFKALNQTLIKPAIKEINTLTNFFIEVESKRIGRRIAELKFRISRIRAIPTIQEPQDSQNPVSFDIDDLPPIAVKLVQAGVSRREAKRISNQEWNGVDAAARPEDTADFAVYVEEKIDLARHATSVKNAGGFIVKAIQENYQNPEFQKQLQAEKAKKKQAMLASLRDEMLEKQHALIRQAVRANPELLEQAAAQITSGFVKERLMAYDSIKDAYDAGTVVAGEINSILAKDLCADLIAPVIAMYQTEIEQLEA